jgi:hypothetical protein
MMPFDHRSPTAGASLPRTTSFEVVSSRDEHVR